MQVEPLAGGTGTKVPPARPLLVHMSRATLVLLSAAPGTRHVFWQSLMARHTAAAKPGTSTPVKKTGLDGQNMWQRRKCLSHAHWECECKQHHATRYQKDSAQSQLSSPGRSASRPSRLVCTLCDRTVQIAEPAGPMRLLHQVLIKPALVVAFSVSVPFTSELVKLAAMLVL